MPPRKTFKWQNASPPQRRRLAAIQRGGGLYETRGQSRTGAAIYCIRDGGTVPNKMVTALIGKGLLIPIYDALLEGDTQSYRVAD